MHWIALGTGKNRQPAWHDEVFFCWAYFGIFIYYALVSCLKHKYFKDKIQANAELLGQTQNEDRKLKVEEEKNNKKHGREIL